MKKILITGGAGYIGSNINKQLIDAGYHTFIIDNLSKGNPKAIVGGTFIRADFGDEEVLTRLFTQHKIEAVMHLAADLDVGESVINPSKYYQNNLTKTLTLLNAMVKHKVKYFIFSSSASVYGVLPNSYQLKETDRCAPESPYGRSKLMIEDILKDYDVAYGLKACSLRYFNAAGADPSGIVKNYKKQEKNLIPRLFQCLKEEIPFLLYGSDYPTYDGTCVRDYIHVYDLGVAHQLAMEKLFEEGVSACYNLGNGKGVTVLEVIEAVQKVTKKSLKIVYDNRRPGDPPVLQSDTSKANTELNWKPQYLSIESMIEHAWYAIESECLENEQFKDRQLEKK